MTGIVDVGGGMKAIYGAGVCDFLLDNDVSFDYAIGVSAGSANLVTYLGRQKKRNYTFYTQYTQRHEYMSLRNFILHRSYIDLNYVYGTLTNSDGENPLDYETFAASPSKFEVVATNALTGEAHYFNKSDMKKDSYDILKGSSAIPVVCRPFIIGGVPYYDGGLSDPVPVKRALDEGCDKVVVLLSRPADFIRQQKKDIRPSKLLRHRYPNAAKALFTRAKSYNDGVALAKKYERDGKAVIIAPDDLNGAETLTRDPVKLDWLYKKGYKDAERIIEFI